jgi:hypothetical protein
VDLKLPRVPAAPPLAPRPQRRQTVGDHHSRLEDPDANLRDLDALLRRVGARPEGTRSQEIADSEALHPACPTKPRIQAPAAEHEPVVDERRRREWLDGAPAVGGAHADKTSRTAIRRHHPGVVGLGVAVAAIALLAFALHLGAMERLARLGTRVTSLEEQRQGAQRLIAERLAIQDKKIAEIATHLDEARYPSMQFKNAQDLMAAGRFQEAEASYGALLSARPTSALSPIVAANSALANVMLGNCSMLRSRLTQLRGMRPSDELLQRSDALLTECTLRRQQPGR